LTELTAGSSLIGRKHVAEDNQVPFRPADGRRSRYVSEVRRACENGDMLLIRGLFAEARCELGVLRGLLPFDVEVELGLLLKPKYEAGASLPLLAKELGRTAQYAAKVLRLAGATIRPAYRPVAAPR